MPYKDPEKRKEYNRERQREYRKKHPDYDRKYRESHLEQERARGKKYHRENLEKDRARIRKYSKDHPDKARERNRKHYKLHSEKERQRVRNYRKLNHGKIIEYGRRYYKEHIEEKRKYSREYSRKHREKNREGNNKWRKLYPEKVKEYRREYYRKHSKIWKEYRDKILGTPKGKIDHRMSANMGQSLKGMKAGRRWESLVGYTVEDLKQHLQSKFIAGMTWEKFMAGEIHIDHIIPKSLFQYDCPEDKEFKQCWSLANLQPLWAVDNIRKRNFISPTNK